MPWVANNAAYDATGWVNGGLKAGTREIWVLATGRMFTRENKLGRIGMGEYIREESVTGQLQSGCHGTIPLFPGLFCRVFQVVR